jgi:hypothetical protein
MSEQIKMTEEQFEVAFKFFIDVSFNDSYQIILNDAKKKNLICKSELEILIEEAENILNEVLCVGNTKIIKEAFQAMKSELNKRREG